MIYLLPITFLFVYLYLESQIRHQLEFNMIRLINQSTQLYERGAYYEKRNFVIDNLLADSNWFIRSFVSEYKLNKMYRKLLLLYPTYPYIL